MNKISKEYQKRLFEISEKGYAEFTAKLTPNIDGTLFIGVRVPAVRKLAKELYKAGGYEDFLKDLPHKYFDENMLHGLILAEFKDYDKCIEELEKFLPYVDNWAVCDIVSPKVFKKNKDKLIKKVKLWSESNDIYTCRFGMGMLMSHYLDDNFCSDYLEIPAGVISEEYYINMMIAWFFATALAKQWEDTIPYIQNNRLPKWVHNKTIQKAIESYRITEDQKSYLRTLKIK